jgi:hypothetical protein
MVRLMVLLSEHAHLVRYPPGDVRGPLDRLTWNLTEEQLLRRLHAGQPIQFDCSQCFTQLCRWAGLSDPSGFGYRVCGYTGTILAYAEQHGAVYIDPRRAGIGAPCVFGPGTGEHVSTVMEPGPDPLLGGHGRPGFDELRLSVERTWHEPPVRFCSIEHL